MNQASVEPISTTGKVIHELNDLLSNYHIYYQKLRKFHWHVSGPHFFELHGKFEALYNDARSQIDEIAERILTIGSRPIGNLTEYLRTSEIKELSDTLTDREMVQQIVNDQSMLTEKMKILIDSASQVGDEGTVDMISGFLAMMEKESWMLKAWLA